MFDFKIENIAETLQNQSKLFNCSLQDAWDKYIHDIIKSEFTLEEVLNYIEDMQIHEIIEKRMKNDNGERYTLNDVKEMINKRRNK